jgi:hypothetical protein
MLLRVVLVVVTLILGSGLSVQPANGASSAQTSVQSVDSKSFFCSFACTPGACAVSRQIFERCKKCPQAQVAGCLMAASGVPIDAARTAENAGTMLPPPGNCPAPDAKGGGPVKQLNAKGASDDKGNDDHVGVVDDSKSDDEDNAKEDDADSSDDSGSSSSKEDEDPKDGEDSSGDEDPKDGEDSSGDEDSEDGEDSSSDEDSEDS